MFIELSQILRPEKVIALAHINKQNQSMKNIMEKQVYLFSKETLNFCGLAPKWLSKILKKIIEFQEIPQQIFIEGHNDAEKGITSVRSLKALEHAVCQLLPVGKDHGICWKTRSGHLVSDPQKHAFASRREAHWPGSSFLSLLSLGLTVWLAHLYLQVNIIISLLMYIFLNQILGEWKFTWYLSSSSAINQRYFVRWRGDWIAILYIINQQMQQKVRNRRAQTLDSEERFVKTMHNGLNYFSELNIPQFKIRKPKKVKAIHSESLIEDTALYETLQENKNRLGRVCTEINDLRELEFNEYIKKSIRYQELLNINDNKKKHLPTMNTKVGEVIKKAVTDIQPRNIVYKLQVNGIKVEGWKPESREGHTLVIFKDEAFLIGGHCSQAFAAINIYSFFNNTWLKPIPCESPRSYHSTIVYKNRFAVVFGGMGRYNKARKARDCYNSIFLIDLVNKNTRNLKMHNEESVQPRRCHSATLLGRYMLVFGGINTKKDYLSDFVYLDLKELRWYHKEYRVEGKQLEAFLEHGVAKHAAVSTFKPRKNYSFYSSDYQDHEGIYFFGGFNAEEEANIVFQLVLNKFVPTFRRVQFSGNYPSPVSPITEWYNENTILIISGEQNDRQLRLFKVKEKAFVYINCFTQTSPLGGLGSTINAHNGDYYLFFGLGDEGYIGDITQFSINEEVKQTDVKKKKQHLLGAELGLYGSGTLLDSDTSSEAQ